MGARDLYESDCRELGRKTGVGYVPDPVKAAIEKRKAAGAGKAGKLGGLFKLLGF